MIALTDAAGAKTDTFSYDPYGADTGRTGTTRAGAPVTTYADNANGRAPPAPSTGSPPGTPTSR